MTSLSPSYNMKHKYKMMSKNTDRMCTCIRKCLVNWIVRHKEKEEERGYLLGEKRACWVLGWYFRIVLPFEVLFHFLRLKSLVYVPKLSLKYYL